MTHFMRMQHPFSRPQPSHEAPSVPEGDLVLQMVLYGSTDEACGRGPYEPNVLSDSAQYSESHENMKSIECLYLLQAFPKKPVTKHTACFNISGLACTKGASF